MKVEVKKCRKTGLGEPQPSRIMMRQRFVELLLLGVRALEAAAEIAAQEDEAGHPLRVLDGVADRKGAALRDAEEREAVRARRRRRPSPCRRSWRPPRPRLTSQSDSPLPRWSKRTSRQWRASSASTGPQTGLRHSYSRWLSQFGALSTGGPSPMLAQAICTPSGVVAKRTRCCAPPRRSSGSPARRIGGPLPDPDRPGDVLHPLAAHVAEGLADAIADRLMHDVGYADAAGLRQTLQTRGDVHAVAEHVAFVEDDVAEIDPDAIDDPAVLGRALSRSAIAV